MTSPGNCGTVKQKLLIPGGSQPFFSAGIERPALAGAHQPGYRTGSRSVLDT